MEIKSSLLNDKELALVKDSLIKVSEKDGKEKFRVKMLEYINDISDNDDDEFFFDMIEFVRFLDPSSSDTAYTTPHHLIYMNAPSGGDNPIGENVRKWDFIYDHECLHQLWDTWGVENKIKEAGIKYNHYVLNVASDCVINDYLSFIRKKEIPDNLITPEYLKQQFDVEYDRKRDTQYTLYLKLIEIADKLKKDERCQQSNDQNGGGDSQGQQGGSQGQQQGGSQGQNGSNGSNGSSSDDNQSNENKTAEDAQKSADEAKKAAKEAQDAADKAKANGDKDADKKQEAADKAKEAAKEAQEAADKAKEAKDNGDKEGEEKAAKEAQEAADKAKQAANEATGNKNGKKGDSNNKSGGDEKNSGGTGGEGNDESNQESDVDLEELKKRAEQTIEKYKNKISGDLGSFLKKCQSSSLLKETGLVVQTDKAISLWNQQLNTYVKSYVKKKVFQKHREFKRTYQRIKRGSGFVEFGQPIQRGKKLKEDKLVINVAFYVDRSGSMSGTIDKVFDAAYIIGEALKKQFAKEKVVGNIAFKMYTFDDKIEEIPWGKKVQARGGNMSMHQYLKKIEELTGDYMINIFITDGEFSVDANDVTDLLKKLAGCLIYVTNTPSECSTVMKKLSKTNATQLFYIDADKDFNIK